MPTFLHSYPDIADLFIDATQRALGECYGIRDRHSQPHQLLNIHNVTLLYALPSNMYVSLPVTAYASYLI